MTPVGAVPIPSWPSDPFLFLPAIDLRQGRCVRLRQGDFAQVTAYSDDPLSVALRWQQQGAKALHIVDLDGAAAGKPVQIRLLARLAENLRIPLEYGGGLRTEAAVEQALLAGAARVVVGTRAVLDPDFSRSLLGRFPGRVVIALDARQGRVATHGWRQDSGLTLEAAAVALQSLGATDVLYTDIGRDGMLAGPETAGALALASVGLRVLVSGGVTSLEDVEVLAGLADRGLAGAVVGKALYEGALDLVSAIAAARGTPVAAVGGGPNNRLARRIIPCLDVQDGRVVKGVRFADLRDAGDPVELAAAYDAAGADEIVFYDISASAEGRRTMAEVVARTAAAVFIPLTVGGGIADVEDIRRLLRAGADKVSINTQAVLNPDLLARGADRFGAQCIVLGVDARRVSEGGRWTGRWEVVTHGGRRGTGLDLLEWVSRAERLGAGEVVLNSIDADGTRDGYDLEATRAVAEAVGIPVVASGGAGTLADFYRVLTEGGADAALAASLFHYGLLTVPQVKEYLTGRGVPVRPVSSEPRPATMAVAGGRSAKGAVTVENDE